MLHIEKGPNLCLMISHVLSQESLLFRKCRTHCEVFMNLFLAKNSSYEICVEKFFLTLENLRSTKSRKCGECAVFFNTSDFIDYWLLVIEF